MAQGTLYGVGVGPGDHELLTLKAVRVIREADVVVVPDTGREGSVVASIAGELLADKKLVFCPVPMTHDAQALRAAHEQTAQRLCALLEEGASVAYLCLGDVTLYSSFAYVCDLVRECGYGVELVPGVTSFSAAAARLGTSLCQGEERLVIAPAADEHLGEVLQEGTTTVILKPPKDASRLRALLKERGLLETTSAVVACGMPNERVILRLQDVDEELGYLTVYLVRRACSTNCDCPAHADMIEDA